VKEVGHFTILVDIKPAGGPAIFGHARMKYYGTIPANKSTNRYSGDQEACAWPPGPEIFGLGLRFSKSARFRSFENRENLEHHDKTRQSPRKKPSRLIW
jgi:hypothetical protein